MIIIINYSMNSIYKDKAQHPIFGVMTFLKPHSHLFWDASTHSCLKLLIMNYNFIAKAAFLTSAPRTKIKTNERKTDNKVRQTERQTDRMTDS